MKKFILFSILTISLFAFIYNIGYNENKQYIENRISQVNGTVMKIDLSQDKDLMTYRITYLNNGDKKIRYAIYMTKLGLNDFEFIAQ